ncbi:uncharacterized protein LOC135168980 [Diachasmimorpha longicaudata]|uniref:uncharacterized protein LOC135168980 n=1 Tax=Diachasmimorpha longicaudata TaxID=58733 RepID=UPI0030B89057
MANEIRLSKLRRQRGNIQASITMFKATLDSYMSLPNEERIPERLQFALDNLKERFQRFEEIQEELEEADPEVEGPKRFELLLKYESVVGDALHQLSRLQRSETPIALQERNTLGAPATPNSTASLLSLMRLPELDIPKFDGSYESYHPFWDIYDCTINQNSDLSKVQKLQYFRSLLTGRAAKAIESLSNTEENYDTALEIIKKKFDNTRKIVRRHWELLQEYPRLIRDTPEALGHLVDTFYQHTRALSNLKQPVEQWDLPLIHLIQSKISPETVYLWELKIKDSNLPKYTSLLEFLENRSHCSSVSTSSARVEKSSYSRGRRQAFVTSSVPTAVSCVVCKENHTIMKCPKFKTLTPLDRYKEAKKLSLCINCLTPGHGVNTCNSRSCLHCKKPHNSLLHRSEASPREQAATTADQTQSLAESSHHTTLIVNSSTCDLMVTAKLKVLNNNNSFIDCRALLDTCSTTNFITESLAMSLGLPKKHFSTSVGALNTVTTTTKHIITATIRSRINDEERTITFLTVPTISTMVPGQPLDRNKIKISSNLKLADPDFHQPAPIDMLLGTGTTLSFLGSSKMRISAKDQPALFLMQTALGWVIGGSAPTSTSSHRRLCHLQNTNSLVFDLTKFWEIENTTEKHQLNTIETTCEQHFKEHVMRDPTGRYIVALPFNEKISSLGVSRSRAYNRFKSCEKKFHRDSQLATRYRAVIQEYIDLGHMTEINTSNLIEHGYYLPHHAIFKEGSLTTKLRVVFDGSAKTNTGISLNDALHIGPTIQEDIVSLLTRFRLHRYVLTGDIEKMYRQVLVRPEDRKYQRILWRDDDGPIRTFELNTVTFGLSAAPYLAIRCLHQLADDEQHLYPTAATILKRDFYVDDLITGAQTREEAITIRNELERLMKLGHFNLRQWASNDPTILQDLPAEDINKHLQLGDSTTLKTLGVSWDSTADTIKYSVKITLDADQITKRIILSKTARLFDPLGLLSPVIIVAKTFMQKLWELKLDWDTILPLDLQEEWLKFYKQLPMLEKLTFPRGALIIEATNIQLHGFCDASKMAYGACLYLRSVDKHGNIQVTLLCAKSRVAPLKEQTIPRLELCGAQLLTSLISNVQAAINHKVDEIFYWTDSTVVLHWLNTSPHKLQVFVSNRVAEIQQKTNIKNWKHVRTHENPADLVSRGQTPTEFIKPSLWVYGPTWLQRHESEWPNLQLEFSSHIPDLRKSPASTIETCLASTTGPTSSNIWSSSITKLQRIIAYCLRFKNRRRGLLILDELQTALHAIVYWVQRETFAAIIKELQHPQTTENKSSALAKFAKLTPFLDKDNLLRVGGRLTNANIPYAQRHPLILPRRHPVTDHIIRNEHILQLHAGPQATLYAVRLRFWLLDGRNSVRRIVRACVKCIRHKPPSVDYIMGNLPAARVTESRPFTNVGIDYCGPFFIKEKKVRNRGRIKVYVAVFVCLATKAVHLEIVSDLTTEGFLAALRRFIARRGVCSHIYSDNGTNFVGANNELKEIHEFLMNEDQQQKILQFATLKEIRWHFIPAQSPNFGGLWESAVKSFKHHLKRIVTNELLTFEEFNTLTIEIEAVLNSRPLTSLSTDPNDPIALTPGHFLIGDSLTNLRAPDFRETPKNRLSTWQHIQKLKQDFWARWHREYISGLNVKSKWTLGEHQIKEGTIVIIKEDNLPPMQWALGRVIKTHAGTDGIIRTVTVKTAKGTYERNVRKLAPLPNTDDSTC